MFKKILYPLFITAILGCTNSKADRNGTAELTDPEYERILEAREDSIKLAEGYLLMEKIKHSVTPSVETAPVGASESEDAADDPAFWYNSNHPDASLIFGSNKKGGIYAYDLQGRETAYYALGNINNIDVRAEVVFGKNTIDVLGGSNRTDNSIVLFRIAEDGSLHNLLEKNFTIDTTEIDEVYGFCMYRDKNGTGHAIVNGKSGKINVYAISAKNNFAELTLKYSWKTETQPEGMVADDTNGILFIGEEDRGIWKVNIAGDSKPELIHDSQKTNNPFIEYDIEGLAIYKEEKNPDAGFLLASIQGNFSYAAFERTGTNQYIGSFKIVASGSVDGVEETDGLEIYSGPVGASFPQGILIVQDGFNYENEKPASQNFKAIELGQVITILNNPY